MLCISHITDVQGGTVMKIKVTSIYVQRPGKGAQILHRRPRFREKVGLYPGGHLMADRRLTTGARRDGAAACSQQQPGRQGLPAGDVRAEPARSHVLCGRRAARVRAHESARR